MSFKKNTFSFFTVLLGALLVAGFWPVQAYASAAEIMAKDVQAILRVVGFLEDAPTQESVLAIVYNAADTTSVRHARQVEGYMQGKKDGLIPRLVSASNAGQLTGAKFAFIADNVQAHYSALEPVLKRNKILSFTFERDCLDKNCCAVYINAENKVDIVVNQSVLDKIGARFKPVFMMLVTVI